MNGKITLATLLLAFALTQSAECQITYGIKVGSNYTNLDPLQYSNPSTFQYAWQLGGLGGATFDAYFDDWLTVRAEALISIRRVGYGYQYSTEPKETLLLPRFSMPVLIRSKIFRKATLMAGGQVDLRLAANKTPFLDTREPYELSVIGGLAFQLSERLGLDLRYVHGLMPAALSFPPEASARAASNQMTFSRSFQVSVEYRLKKREEEYYFY